MNPTLTNLTGTDIGKPSHRGSTTPVSQGWDLKAGGEDIWGNADQFHFAWTEFTGDFDLVVRVDALEAGHLYTKAGLMARESLEAGAAHVFHLVFPTNDKRNNNNGGYESQVRSVTDGPSRAFYPPNKGVGTPEFPVAFPDVWLRLTRKGNRWTCGAATDGQAWNPYAEFDLALADRVFAGLAVTAHDDAKTVTARFREFTVG